MYSTRGFCIYKASRVFVLKEYCVRALDCYDFSELFVYTVLPSDVGGLRGKAIGVTEKCDIITIVNNIKGLPNEDSIFDYVEE